jgi:hypothetical protein
MAIDTSVQTFTDAELLNLTRKAIADILVGGQSYGMNGRQLNRADLAGLREQEKYLEDRINAAANAEQGGGIALVQFGDRA